MIATCYLLSLFVVERLFVIVKPKLLTIPWFAKLWMAILGCAHGSSRRSEGCVRELNCRFVGAYRSRGDPRRSRSGRSAGAERYGVDFHVNDQPLLLGRSGTSGTTTRATDQRRGSNGVSFAVLPTARAPANVARSRQPGGLQAADRSRPDNRGIARVAGGGADRNAIDLYAGPRARQVCTLTVLTTSCIAAGTLTCQSGRRRSIWAIGSPG